MTRSNNIGVRVEPDVKEAIAKAAADDRRTMSAWIEIVLVERLQKDGYLPKAKSK